MRNITEEGLKLIMHHEGFNSKEYLCPAGIPTIGYGHVIRKDENFTEISKNDAKILLKLDVIKAERSILRLVNIELSDGQFCALVSFCYNLGGAAFQRSTLRQVINRREHSRVSHELSKWVFVSGKKLQGLIRRRNDEARMYES